MLSLAINRRQAGSYRYKFPLYGRCVLHAPAAFSRL